MSTSDLDRNVISRNGHHRADAAHSTAPQAVAAQTIPGPSNLPQPLNTAQPWHESVPDSVKQPAADGDRDAAWKAWVKYLRRRKTTIRPSELLDADPASYLAWGLTSSELVSDWLLSLVALDEAHFHRDGSTEQVFDLSTWFGVHAEADVQAAAKRDLAFALRALGLAHDLPQSAQHLTQQSWWETLESLVQTVHSAVAITIDKQPLEHQLLAGELAVTLAYLFPEVKACRELLPIGRQALSVGIDEMLDGEGMPHRRFLPLQQALVACWTRCHAMGQALNSNRIGDQLDDDSTGDNSIDGCWTREAEAQYPLAVREVLRLARRDGRAPFSAGAIEHGAIEHGAVEHGAIQGGAIPHSPNKTCDDFSKLWCARQTIRGSMISGSGLCTIRMAQNSRIVVKPAAPCLRCNRAYIPNGRKSRC